MNLLQAAGRRTAHHLNQGAATHPPGREAIPPVLRVHPLQAPGRADRPEEEDNRNA